MITAEVYGSPLNSCGDAVMSEAAFAGSSPKQRRARPVTHPVSLGLPKANNVPYTQSDEREGE
jgi:hypothetical protein